jgi:hypothetical protein
MARFTSDNFPWYQRRLGRFTDYRTPPIRAGIPRVLAPDHLLMHESVEIAHASANATGLRSSVFLNWARRSRQAGGS